jgi:hypothetical protein
VSIKPRRWKHQATAKHRQTPSCVTSRSLRRKPPFPYFV